MPEAETETYGGILGAFPYALRASSSWLFRLYVLLGGLVAVLLTVGFGLSLLGVLASTAGVGGGTFSFVRTFVIVVGLAVVFPLLVPVILVARRYRRGHGDERYDAALGATGFGYTLSLYLAAVVSTPTAQQEPVSGRLATIVEALYALPRLSALAFPIIVVAAMYVAHRRYG